MREALESAMDKQEAAPEPSAPAQAAPEAVSGPTEVPGGAPAPAMGAPSGERARNPDGTYTKASGTTEPSPAKPAKPVAVVPGEAKAGGASTPPPGPTPPAAAAPEAPKFKAPQSWKPTIREKWAGLPPEVQEEVSRREAEITRALQEVAPAKQFAQRVQSSLAPYETIARANGMDTMAYAGSVLQAAAALQMGAPGQKAALVANLIQTYGVDVDAIASHLSGQAPPQQQAAPPINIQAEIQKALQETIGQAKGQAATQQATAFINTNPEFLSDVAPDMIEILRVAEARGIDMTYEQAYKRACKMNDEVSKIEGQREAAKAATAQNAATQRSVEAASGVKTNPATGQAARPRTTRGAIDAEADRQGLA